MSILALDVGEKRLGMATSDASGTIAQAGDVIERRSWSHLLAEMRTRIAVHRIERIVVGLPLRMDGTEGEEAAKVRAFAARLRAALNVPVDLQDERLSTAEAERVMVAGGARRSQRRLRRDAVAAALILQTYLDRTRGKGTAR